MGSPVAQIGSVSSGHGCFPPVVAISGSGSVFVEGIPIHRVGDGWNAHCCPNQGCHASILASGSGSVFANGIPIGRIGDSKDDGGIVVSGAGSVFAG